MKKKTVRVRCHHPIAIDPNCQLPWADAWISYRTRPNHPHYFGPCLVCKGSLEFDLRITKECQADNLDLDYSDDIERQELALYALELSRFFIEESLHGTPTIYTSNEYIDRNEAVEMLRFFMDSRGFKNVKFRWQIPKIVTIPIM